MIAENLGSEGVSETAPHDLHIEMTFYALPISFYLIYRKMN
jgi:hypothetical protein